MLEPVCFIRRTRNLATATQIKCKTRLGTGRTLGCILGKLLSSSVVGNEESCLFKKRGLEGTGEAAGGKQWQEEGESGSDAEVTGCDSVQMLGRGRGHIQMATSRPGPGWSEAITKKGQAGACGKNSRVRFGLESGMIGDSPRKRFECFYRRDPG